MRYTCPGQVFAFAGPDDLVDAAGEGRALDMVTCWSGGKLNFTRASPEVLAEVTAGLLDDEEVRKLVELRDKAPSSGLAGAMKALALDPQRQRALGEILTDQSNCFSLWVVASDGARAIHRLYVDRTGDMENDSMSWGFAWL